MPKTILLVDDEVFFTKQLAKNLSDSGYDVFTAFNGQEGLEIAREQSPRMAIVDLKLPDMSGLDVIKSLNEFDQPPITIMITAHGYIEAAVSAMRLGAYDFVEKPFPVDKIKIILHNALNSANLRKTVAVATKQEKQKHSLEALIGVSPSINNLTELLVKLAAGDPRMVLITGETGTGKGLASKVLHYAGRRAEKPFLEMNCAAIPENLLESELFGYEAGAFTDAKKSKSGILEDADGGTIFLDEIGDMSLNLQSKLVKVVEERKFRRLGGKKDIKVDLLIIAATNKDLREEVKNNNFRQDLYHRLNVISFEMPCLRERKEDIPLLTDHFIQFFNNDINKSIKTVPEEIRRASWPTTGRAMCASSGAPSKGR